MARRNVKPRGARRHGFPWRALLLMLTLIATGFGALRWLDAHPEHNPFAPLDLAHPVNWTTSGKVANLIEDIPACRAMLTDGGVAHAVLPATGSGACRIADRTQWRAEQPGPLTVPLTPAAPIMTCPVNAALALWLRDRVQPAAMAHLGRRVVRIEHLGTVNCRRIARSDAMSQHATGNAIDIAAFILSDGRRVALLDHWDAADGRSAFLRAARDGACDIYATILSPDFNRAHADHLHLDMADRSLPVCR